MKAIKFALLLAVLTVSGFAQSKVGTTAANFLTIPVGPRATGMGGAFVASANDATSLFWNAGAISRMPQSEFNVSYSQWLVGTNYNFVGLVFKLDDDNAVGVSVNQLSYGEEDITTEEQPMGTGQKWDAGDIAIGITYTKNLTDRFSIGGTFKYINQRVWNESASAFALDIGLLFYTQLDGLRIGMNIANFGTEMKLDGKDLLQPIDIDPAQTGNNANITGKLETDSWTLPLMFTVGLAYDVVKDADWNLMLATDAVYPNNNSSYINVGGEFSYSDLIFLRGGYNSLFKEAAEEGFSAGVGVKYNFGPFYSKVDYSFSDYGIFKSLSRISLTIGF